MKKLSTRRSFMKKLTLGISSPYLCGLTPLIVGEALGAPVNRKAAIFL